MSASGRGSELIVVANRLPVRSLTIDGESRWVSSPGGLVSALTPSLRSVDRPVWIGWSGIIGAAPASFEHGGIRLEPVSLDDPDYEGFYEGFSNGCLWPLYHDSIERPRFHRPWWNTYVAVNEKFAERAAEVAGSEATVWIHDYQLQLVPRMLRELRPDLRIGFFLHIPFPARELFLRLPWRRQVAEGILGADVVGFQTPVTAANFRNAAARVADVTVSGRSLLHDGRSIAVESFPIGIDADRCRRMAADPQTVDRTREIREQLGSSGCLMLGVDRLDYTKGIELRLQAIRELLDEGRLDPQQITVVQIAEPSRGNVPGYATVQAEVERLVGGINGDFGGLDGRVVYYQHQTMSFRDLTALYSLADIMLVTPFRDGMNLVAKEYVSARRDIDGVLVLSEFAGAANELRQALLVNPYDIESVKDTIVRAVHMPAAEQRRRMRSMQRVVERNSAFHWANSFLSRLGR